MPSVVRLHFFSKYLLNQKLQKDTGWFVKQNLLLKFSFNCDQIHMCQRYLLCYLGQTCMFNKLASENLKLLALV